MLFCCLFDLLCDQRKGFCLFFPFWRRRTAPQGINFKVPLTPTKPNLLFIRFQFKCAGFALFYEICDGLCASNWKVTFVIVKVVMISQPLVILFHLKIKHNAPLLCKRSQWKEWERVCAVLQLFENWVCPRSLVYLV